MKSNFALYRLPGETNICHYIECDDKDLYVFHSYSSIEDIDGFVIAPFQVNSTSPITIIKRTDRTKDKILTLQELEDCSEAVVKDDYQNVKDTISSYERAKYSDIFNLFHKELEQGTVKKVVLSRQAKITDGDIPSLFSLFKRACSLSKDSFVSLFSTNKTGAWLTATPEILLERDHGICHTMALAGTQNIESLRDWSDSGKQLVWNKKNIEEQKYVSDYIYNILTDFSDDVKYVSPRTVSAGNVAHIRSDFFFTPTCSSHVVGKIIAKLHPTPAVCGLPKDQALKLIQDYESNDRKYYSGFCGPMSCQDDFHLFVTLRCMNITPCGYVLYAGGGILLDSNDEEEWNETVSKMQTMARCII